MSNIANVTIASDATVKVGNKTFTIDAAVKHAVAVYDAMWLLQEQMLGHYHEIGNILLGLQALFADNRKAFGKFLEGSELGAMSRQDRSDAMFLAANWDKVSKLNKDGSLDTLGVSAIRKRLKASEGKASNGAGKRKHEQEAGNAPDGNAPEVDIKAVKVQSEVELADVVMALIQANGLDFTKFAKALAAKRKGA
jgi:NACalpha-BTF3-like transcription factor